MSFSDNTTDEILIEKARHGSEESFSILMTKYRPLVWGIAFRMCLNEEDAYDVCQEAAIRVWRSLPHYRSENKFSSWLRVIVSNETLRWLKRYVKGNEKVSLDESPEFMEELGSVEPNVRENLDREERLEIILCEMKRLSPQQRMALTLRYFEGLPLSEIAGILKCSEGSVKQHLYRAMDRLKHILCVKEVR